MLMGNHDHDDLIIMFQFNCLCRAIIDIGGFEMMVIHTYTGGGLCNDAK
jgi:hypothetical protein